MRITKDLAAEMATAMLKERYDVSSTLHKNLKTFTENAVLKTIPEVVVRAYKAYPNYFNRVGQTRIANPGMGNEVFYFMNSLPLAGKMPTIEQHEAEDILSMSDKLKTLKEEYKVLHSKIEVALYNLRTFKRVQEQFPEAAAFLPQVSETGTAVILNLKELRCEINPSTCK